MTATARFHARFRSDLDDEIGLAENLYIAALFRWGKVRLPRLLRTDPAAVFQPLAYAREPGAFGWRCLLIHGWDVCRESRAGNEFILSPAHAHWNDFHQRLGAELISPDFDWQYGPASTCGCRGGGKEYWPLCAASLVAEFGCAVAESLALFAAFMGDTDRDIHDHVETLWNQTRPRPGTVPFDLRNGGATA